MNIDVTCWKYEISQASATHRTCAHTLLVGRDHIGRKSYTFGSVAVGGGRRGGGVASPPRYWLYTHPKVSSFYLWHYINFDKTFTTRPATPSTHSCNGQRSHMRPSNITWLSILFFCYFAERLLVSLTLRLTHIMLLGSGRERR